MLKLQRVLVPIKDVRQAAPAAALKAAQLARRTGATIELLHIHNDFVDVYALPDGLDPSKFEASEHRKRLRRMEPLAQRLRRHGVRVDTTVVTDYPAHEAIIRRAQRTRADLIVLDAHGRHRAAALLRPTDWELLRQSPVPVLFVKDRKPYRRPAILAAVDPRHAFSKPSGLDPVILDAGSAMQSALAGRLHVVHAFVAIPAVAMTSGTFSPELAKSLQTVAEKQARTGLTRLLRKAAVPATRQHLEPRHPQDAIPLVAGRVGAGIVVMGAISRSGLKRIFVGNTAERLLDELRCDVLVVKPKSFRARVPKTARGIRWRFVGASVPL